MDDRDCWTIVDVVQLEEWVLRLGQHHVRVEAAVLAILTPVSMSFLKTPSHLYLEGHLSIGTHQLERFHLWFKGEG